MYFKLNGAGEVIDLADEFPKEDRKEWTMGRDCKDMQEAATLAGAATISLSRLFLPVDRGSHVHPRYDVIEAPRVGDEVSYGFNGDYYPDGVITKIGGTACSRIYTSTGSVYNRRRQSASWIKRGGTWSMVKGHRNERNPSF